MSTATLVTDTVLSKPWFHVAGEEDKQWLHWLMAAEDQDREKRMRQVPRAVGRPPETQEERNWVCGAWAFRGRGELKGLCSASSRAVAYYNPDLPTLTFLFDHISDESHHAVEMIECASRWNPGTNYWTDDPEWEGKWSRSREWTPPPPGSGKFADYLLEILPTETGGGLYVFPYYTFAIQLQELIDFGDEVVHSDEATHFVFFMWNMWKLLRQAKGTERTELESQLLQRYRSNLAALDNGRMQFWKEVLIPHCGADPEFIAKIPELRRSRFEFILSSLGVSEPL